MKFMRSNIEPNIKTFIIDPLLNNPRAIHVYKKAGFEQKCEYIQEGSFFDKSKGVLMIYNMT